MKTDHRKTFLTLLQAISSLAIAILTSSCTGIAQQAEQTPLPPLSQSEMKVMKAIGATLDDNGDIRLDTLTIHRREKCVSFPAGINIRGGQIEVLVSGLNGRTHESLLVTSLDPFKLQLALILLGSRNGPAAVNKVIPMGDSFTVMIETSDGVRRNADEWLVNSITGKPKSDDGYIFIGSNFSKNNKCLASVEGNLININSMDLNTILCAKLPVSKVNDMFEAASDKIPDPDLKGKTNPTDEDFWTPVKVILIPRLPSKT